MTEGGVRILVSSLKKTFSRGSDNSIDALKGISFSCAQGEIYGLLGPNGAGKTTTLRILATLLQPSSGCATVNGFDVTEQPVPVRRSLGFLSGTTGLYPRLTARETLEFFGRLFGMRGEGLTQRIEEVVQWLEMESFAHVPCEKLSTGMKQRVSIGRTVIHDPDVLILDEPTTGLDVLAAAGTRDFIRSARSRGKCVLMSTHVMSEAEALCDRIGILHEGRLLAEGSVQELKETAGADLLEDAFLTYIRGRGGKETAG